jgi:tRNA threonylcarbamoyladenosine biosynthesis protein TsaB
MGDDILEREVLAGQRHSELILPMIEEIMGEGGISLRDLHGIAFGSGPGSFTGLRIACGVAQGLSFGLHLPVVGVGTLHALAACVSAARVVACLDARMGEIYHASFERIDGVLQCVQEPGLYSPMDAPQLPGVGWVGCGSGFAAHGKALGERFAGKLEGIEAGLRPSAREMAKLAVSEFAAGRGLDSTRAMPLYIRNKVALKESER